jgi:hypothetical protein
MRAKTCIVHLFVVGSDSFHCFTSSRATVDALFSDMSASLLHVINHLSHISSLVQTYMFTRKCCWFSNFFFFQINGSVTKLVRVLKPFVAPPASPPLGALVLLGDGTRCMPLRVAPGL